MRLIAVLVALSILVFTAAGLQAGYVVESRVEAIVVPSPVLAPPAVVVYRPRCVVVRPVVVKPVVRPVRRIFVVP